MAGIATSPPPRLRVDHSVSDPLFRAPFLYPTHPLGPLATQTAPIPRFGSPLCHSVGSTLNFNLAEVQLHLLPCTSSPELLTHTCPLFAGKGKKPLIPQQAAGRLPRPPSEGGRPGNLWGGEWGTLVGENCWGGRGSMPPQQTRYHAPPAPPRSKTMARKDILFSLVMVRGDSQAGVLSSRLSVHIYEMSKSIALLAGLLGNGENQACYFISQTLITHHEPSMY